MASLGAINVFLFVGALLVLLGILSSLIATRFGAPLLLVFLVIGMLAGEDGPGGIRFDNVETTYLVGSIALAIILFDGGLRTRIATFRGILAPAVVMATLGVLLTAALTGLAVMLIFEVSFLHGMLLGAIVGSTDAAAVFFLLRSGGLELRRRVGSTLEVESSTNDPMAMFLTLVLIELVVAPGADDLGRAGLMLLQQAAVGAAAGLAGGAAVCWLLNRVELPGGLHPLLVLVAALLVFGAANLLGGSGFLATYLAGLVVGNRPVRAYASIIDFHDTATWLCQILMFVLLGLLVTPTRLLDSALPALGVAAALMFLARPAATFLCLLPFRFALKELAFVSWVGLRGAVSIFLAILPLLAGLPEARLFFDVAFFVVLTSLLAQGWTLNAAARRLKVALPRTAASVQRVELDLPGQLAQELVGYPIRGERNWWRRASLPRWARLVLVVREGAILDAAEAGELRPGDYGYFLAPPERAHRLDRLFALEDEEQEGQRRPSEFALHADVTLGALADLYGLEVPPEERDWTLERLFAERFEDGPRRGDRLAIGRAVVIARGIEEERLAAAALMLDDPYERLLAEERRQGPRAWLERQRAGWRRSR
ncbi:potassium/proton antiporter [Geminicoccaceae bacterium 1502E]|nr:potassium/proton antiporter [Geminicoccaceae bacterium 1502E]